MKTTSSVLFLLLVSVLTGFSQQTRTTTSKNKELTLRIFKAFEAGDTTALDALIAKDVISHAEMSNTKLKGLQAVKEMVRMQKISFPNMQSKIHAIGLAGDTVMVYYTSMGINSGPFMGMPATNKRINVEGVDIIRFQNVKAVEHWGVYDHMKMMQQMGMMGGPGTSQAPAPHHPAKPQTPATPDKQ